MNFSDYLARFPKHAVDIKLNLAQLTTEEGAVGLMCSQIAGIALACAVALRDRQLVEYFEAHFEEVLSLEIKTAAEGAAYLMAMNNLYYRFKDKLDDPEISQMPAKLRMNFYGNPGVDKIDFELYTFAVSVINGCEYCLKAHRASLLKLGVSSEALHSAGKLAAVINAASTLN